MAPPTAFVIMGLAMAQRAMRELPESLTLAVSAVAWPLGVSLFLFGLFVRKRGGIPTPVGRVYFWRPGELQPADYRSSPDASSAWQPAPIDIVPPKGSNVLAVLSYLAAFVCSLVGMSAESLHTNLFTTVRVLTQQPVGTEIRLTDTNGHRETKKVTTAPKDGVRDGDVREFQIRRGSAGRKIVLSFTPPGKETTEKVYHLPHEAGSDPIYPVGFVIVPQSEERPLFAAWEEAKYAIPGGARLSYSLVPLSSDVEGVYALKRTATIGEPVPVALSRLRANDYDMRHAFRVFSTPVPAPPVEPSPAATLPAP